MFYFIDTEFNEFGGDLISLALVREDNESIYIIYPLPENPGPWVSDHVIPVLKEVPSPMPGMLYEVNSLAEGAVIIQNFIGKDDRPCVIADWPEDLIHFNRALLTGPGQMVNMPNIVMQVVQSKYLQLEGAVRHNAWHDARSLKSRILDFNNGPAPQDQVVER